ncbi:hypothetical protein TIFTF001_029618 [Ficus carica]|uniref:Core Histone H2A/H2B/H3 domain-containing protein n=1 Tax=Ficus carica TaxID=3494 RepID=A0AA88DRW1_FICCA|nr:hypothetical protein TIFTF001_029618 [Ficus carica]
MDLKRRPGRPGKSDRGAPETPGVARSPGTQRRRKFRYKPGTVALREIRYFQRSSKLLIPALPFIRCVKEISNQLSPDITRWQAEALMALQEICIGANGSMCPH